MRKVYLEELPRLGGKSQRIDWKNSIGYKLKFEYEDIIGEFEIIDYDKRIQELKVLYNGVVKNTKPATVANCMLANILGLISKDYIYTIGDTIEVNTGSFEVLEQVVIPVNDKSNPNSIGARGYKYKCLKCGYTDSMRECYILSKRGCPVCSGQKVSKGINDIWTTHPNIAKLLLNFEEGYKYSYGSDVKVDWKCPDCGEITKGKTINKVVSRGLGCKGCSDGISYSEKLMYNVFKQLNIIFKTQKIFNWSQNRKYDFYLSDLNIICEIHGAQHYIGGFERAKGRTLHQEQENDKLKERLAMENGIKQYIIIDARESELYWIKKNILDSDLSILFNFSEVDWQICHGYACKSLVITVSELWSQGITNINDICQMVNLSNGTVRRYLVQGAQLGLCEYSAEQAIKLRNKNMSYIAKEKCSKKVICITTNKIFDSIKEAYLFYDVTSGITESCTGKYYSAGVDPETNKRLLWMYLDDYTIEKAKEKIKIFQDAQPKPIVQLDLNYQFIMQYPTLNDAIKSTNVLQIANCCKNKPKYKTAGGFKWMYLPDYEQYLLSKYQSQQTEQQTINL